MQPRTKNNRTSKTESKCNSIANACILLLLSFFCIEVSKSKTTLVQEIYDDDKIVLSILLQKKSFLIFLVFYFDHMSTARICHNSETKQSA